MRRKGRKRIRNTNIWVSDLSLLAGRKFLLVPDLTPRRGLCLK
jgi:hypothetical protein